MHDPRRLIDRRQMLARSAAGLGGLALQWLMQRDQARAGSVPANPLAPKPPHHPARAKACIFLFMVGGPSQIDLFDPKPVLNRLHGQRLPEHFGNVEGQFVRDTDVLMGTPRRFRKYGQSGIDVSDLMPHTAGIVDDIALIRSCHCDSFIHESAEYQFTTGRVVQGFPSIGSWITYGLGSEAEDLPAFVVLPEPKGLTAGGKPLWGSGFLPVVHQGSVFRPGSSPIPDLEPPAGRDRGRYRRMVDAVRDLDAATADPADAELAARISSYELAFRMQTAASEAVDLAREPRETQELYGIGTDATDDFGRRCLLARRFVERGVRFVLVLSGWGSNEQTNWDSHQDLEESHGRMCRATDKPVAGLMRDLKRRGLLDETLVVWGGEFGRTPLRESNLHNRGRDHNPGGYSMWLAGGGVKGGTVVGATDDIGLRAVENPCHVHAVHATILHQMGLDFQNFTVLHHGRDERLTDVGGRLIHEII